EGAALVAAVADLQIRARAAYVAGGDLEIELTRQRELDQLQRAAGCAGLFELRDHAGQGRPVARTNKGIDERQLRRQLGRVALDQAAGGDQLLITAFAFAELQQCVDRLLLGRLDEPAGIDDEQ